MPALLEQHPQEALAAYQIVINMTPREWQREQLKRAKAREREIMRNLRKESNSAVRARDVAYDHLINQRGFSPSEAANAMPGGWFMACSPERALEWARAYVRVPRHTS